MADPKYMNIGVPEDLVIEECSELIQSIIKAKRFGWHTINPKTGHDNIFRVESEMNDVLYQMHKLENKLNNLLKEKKK